MFYGVDKCDAYSLTLRSVDSTHTYAPRPSEDKLSRCRHYSSCVLLCARYKSNWHVCIYMACRNGLFNQKTVNCHVALRWLLLSHCQNSCSSFSGHSRYIVMLYCDPFIISMQNRSYVGCGQSLLVFIDPFIPA